MRGLIAQHETIFQPSHCGLSVSATRALSSRHRAIEGDVGRHCRVCPISAFVARRQPNAAECRHRAKGAQHFGWCCAYQQGEHQKQLANPMMWLKAFTAVLLLRPCAQSARSPRRVSSLTRSTCASRSNRVCPQWCRHRRNRWWEEKREFREFRMIFDTGTNRKHLSIAEHSGPGPRSCAYLWHLRCL